MALIVTHVFAGIVAWNFSLSFIQMDVKEKWLDSVVIALLCGISAFAMNTLGYGKWVPLAELLLFLLLAVTVQFQKRDAVGDSVLAFFFAQWNFSLLVFLDESGYSYSGVVGLVLMVIPMVVSLILTVKLRDRFPEKGWRDYFRNDVSEPERINFRLRHIYLIVVIIGVIPTVGRIILQPAQLADVILWGLAGESLFWISVLFILLMYAYKKERLAVLVEQQYREETQSFMNVIRSQRHDYNFHVQTIAGLIEAEKYEECRTYVNALVKDSETMNAILPVSDPAISATINSFLIIASRESIELHIDIQNDLSQIASNVYETNKIISNLLQNAVDETVQHKDKSYGIWLTILKRGEYCIIKVTNELENRQLTADDLGQLYKQGYTTKTGHDGVGLSSVRTLAYRYKGTVYTQLDGNLISFIVKIPINYAKKPSSD